MAIPNCNCIGRCWFCRVLQQHNLCFLLQILQQSFSSFGFSNSPFSSFGFSNSPFSSFGFSNSPFFRFGFCNSTFSSLSLCNNPISSSGFFNSLISSSGFCNSLFPDFWVRSSKSQFPAPGSATVLFLFQLLEHIPKLLKAERRSFLLLVSSGMPSIV